METFTESPALFCGNVLTTLTQFHTLTAGTCPGQLQSDLLGTEQFKGLAHGHLSGGNEGGANVGITLSLNRFILLVW